ncbi:unnamed protein product [Symbiodinium sp. KB8]|nr:unnamed protein product [Symbiodinium sp. KB8]
MAGYLLWFCWGRGQRLRVWRWRVHHSAVMDGQAGVGAHYFDVVRGSSAMPSSAGSRVERAGGKQLPVVAKAVSEAAASDAARAHWEHLGARVYGAGCSSGVVAGKGTVGDFTKVIDGSASSKIRFSLLHSFRFDKWLWTRVGEALHPGPQVPRRSRKAGLTKGDVKRLVKSMVLQLAEQFFGQPTSGPAPPENSVPRPPKGKGKTAQGSPEQGKGRPAQQAAEKGDKGSGKAGKEGKPSPPWRRSRGPPGGGTSEPASAVGLQSTSKGKGKPEGNDKGKGKGSDTSAESALRPQARRPVNCVERELDKGEAVLVYTDKSRELQEFGELMRGGCHPASLLLYDGEATAELDHLKGDYPVERRSLPGVLRGSLKLRKCWVVAMQRGQPEVGELPLDVEVDFIEARPPKQRSAYQESVVLRASCAQCFTDKDRWKRVLHRPGAALREWTTRVGGSPADLLDSWSWEKSGDTQALHPSGVVKGLVRLSPSAARAFLAAGGRCAGGTSFFFQPLKWADLTLNQPALLWEAQRPDEMPGQYLRRVVALSGDMGLYHDGKRLAVRIDPRDPRNAARQGLWHLRQVPLGWHVAELEEVLVDVGFEQVEIQARYRDRRAARWTFLALRTDRRDYVPIKIEDEALGTIELEASRHRRQGRKDQAGEAIKPERRQSVAVKSQEAASRDKGAGKGAKGAVTEASRGPELSRDPFDDLLAFDVDVESDVEAGDNPMMGNKRQAAAVAPTAKKPKQPKLVLPPGATVISNEGGGNCLPAAVAQALTSHAGKQFSHRGVRRAMISWMREQASHLQPLWDGRDTSDKPCQLSFVEYLSAVEAVGSWCGNLEVYALSRGLPANLLVLDFDSEAAFKFASQADSDPFIVLKFSGKHYEWIQCSPEALVDIWCHAAVGNTVGGRGGGFMCIDTASEASMPAVVPAAGAPEGGQFPRMVIDTASSAGSGVPLDRGGGSAELAPVPPVVGGHMVFDDLSAVGSRPSSLLAGDLDSVRAHRPPRSWPTPADLRSLSSASSTRPVLLPPRRRLRAKTNHWVSLSAVAKAGADVEVPGVTEIPLELSVPEPVARQPKSSRYRVGDVVRWPCPLCPMVIETRSPDTLQKRRYDHCHRQHGGQGLPGTKRVNFDAFRTLGPDEPEDWRCPLGNWGLPVGSRGGMTSKTFARAKEFHRKAKHRHVSPKDYLSKIKARGARKPAHRMQARVRLLNAGVAKRQKEGLAAIPGWTFFRWPFVANKAKQRVLKVTQAWSCVKCGLCTRVAKKRQMHEGHCHEYNQSILEGVRARHRAAFEEAKTLGHGVAPDLLTQMLVSADLAMGGDGYVPPGGGHQYSERGHLDGRLAYSAVALEFLFHSGVRKVVVVSVYGFASDCEAAANYAEEVVLAVRGLGMEWLLLGDFNVTVDEAPMARRLAAGWAEPLDSAFMAAGPLPGTAGGHRRIDYGLSAGRLRPVALSHTGGVGNHTAVSYEFSFTDPSGHSTPARAPLGADDVSEAAWAEHWDAPRFHNLLMTKDVDGAWCMLSNAAEAALGGTSRGVVARSASWTPQGAKHRSKAAKGFESLGLVRLRRLSRRLTQLARCPEDARLRDIVGRNVGDLQALFPWLQDLPFFTMEQQAEWVHSQVEEAAKVELEAGFARWRSSLSGSTKKQTAWIKRRASLRTGLSNPRWSTAEEMRRTAIHPVEVIRRAEAEWCPRWTAGEIEEGPVRELLSELVPPVRGSSTTPTFSSTRLLRVASKMRGKACGPDGWEASHFLSLPGTFWQALGDLWQCAFESAKLPARWREARVALVPKQTGGCRPISVLSVAYRLGAALLVRDLREWADGWLGHRMLGGVHRRSTRDVFLRIIEASDDPAVVFVGQDVSKFFDSIHAQHLLQVLRFLRAPQLFVDFVQGVLSEQWRVFSTGSWVGATWHRATRGLAQGDPMSPLLAAAVMSVWTGTVAQSACEAVTFVDDRSFWGRSLHTLAHAKRLSDRVDRAFQFRCDATKCQVASAGGAVGPQAAVRFGYEHSSEFETLGVRFYLRPGCVPMLARYSFEVADVRLQCINVVATSLPMQSSFIRSLVLPLVSWAGAMASIEKEQLLQLRRAVVASVNHKNACDTPALLLWEVLGWDCDPVFTRKWSALRAAIATACQPPCWLEDASIQFATRRWPTLLPVATAVLGELGWWTSATGDIIGRRDEGGRLRTFYVGYDNELVLKQWLVDWHRRASLQETARVKRRLHRSAPDGDLAQGVLLPGVPANALCVMAGHRKLFPPQGERHLRNSSLATGCSVWAKAKKKGVSAEAIAECMCGQRMPSRPHLLWQCSGTAHLRPRCAAPSNRAEERLLCKVVPELPPSPCVIGEDEVVEELAAVLDQLLRAQPIVFVGTDGSCIHDIAAWSVAVQDGPVFSSGVAGEDQSAYRGEVEAIRRLLMAVQMVRTTGRLVVISDCQSAMLAVDGCGHCRLLVEDVARRWQEIRSAGIEATIHWIPSHGKPAPAAWPTPPGGEVPARILNGRADEAARLCATRRASGSAREACAAARAAAAAWEEEAITGLAKIAKFYDDW